MLDSVTGILHVLSDASHVMFWFLVSATLLCICILMTVHLSFILLSLEYESRHFLRTEARVSSELASFFKLLMELWNISGRANKNATEENIERDQINLEGIKLGMKFYFVRHSRSSG